MSSKLERITPAEVDEKRLPFVDHLRELRNRTMRAVAYVVVGVLAAWGLRDPLFAWFAEPYTAAMHELTGSTGQMMSFSGPMEPIVVYLRISVLFGVLAAFPLILLEAWLFVAPGLYRSERQMAVPFLLASTVFFLGGALFCRYVVLDMILFVLLQFGGENEAVIMMDDYFSFTSRLLFVFACLFELPVVTSFLAALGLISHRGLIRNWRYAIVLAFVIGGAATPPDPLSQIFLAVPLSLLYGLSILLAKLITDRREKSDGVAEPEVSA